MSSIILRISDRPPKGGQGHTGEVFARVAQRVLFGLFLIVSLVATAWAQDTGRPRTDPGDPPQVPGDNPASGGWQLLTIPGLPANALLGDVWVAPNGDVFVWANYPSRTAAGTGDPSEGERLPNKDRSNPRSSTLYQYNGTIWTMALNTPGETAGAVYGTSSSDIYASTTGALGDARLYRFNGSSWTPATVAGYHLGRMHTITGGPGDMYFRVDRVLMNDVGQGFQPVYEMPGDETPVRGLVYYDNSHVMMMCPEGCVFEDNGVYSEVPTGFSLGDVQDSWGARDAQGALEIFAIGSTLQQEGIRVWRFIETNPQTHAGDWLTVLADPPTSTGQFNIGNGSHIWGTATSDVYATGLVMGEGHMLHFDGLVWQHLAPPFAFGAVHGVYGNVNGATWFSLDAGQMIHYQAPGTAPVVTNPAPISLPVPQTLQATQFQGGLRIRYELKAAAPVKLGVYDLAGRLCATIEDGTQTTGVHELNWDTSALHPGIYFVSFRAGNTAFSRRVVVTH